MIDETREKLIRHHMNELGLLLAERMDAIADQKVQPAPMLTRREWATVAAALHCWGESFEQAANEQDWPEIEIAGGGANWEPLNKLEIEALQARVLEVSHNG